MRAKETRNFFGLSAKQFLLHGALAVRSAGSRLGGLFLCVSCSQE